MGHLSCGQCRTTLAYPPGATTVGCPTCRNINPVRVCVLQHWICLLIIFASVVNGNSYSIYKLFTTEQQRRWLCTASAIGESLFLPSLNSQYSWFLKETVSTVPRIYTYTTPKLLGLGGSTIGVQSNSMGWDH